MTRTVTYAVAVASIWTGTRIEGMPGHWRHVPSSRAMAELACHKIGWRLQERTDVEGGEWLVLITDEAEAHLNEAGVYARSVEIDAQNTVEIRIDGHHQETR